VCTLRWRCAKKRSPKTPAGVRIYVVGDVHGRADLLAQVLASIDADIGAYSGPQIIQVFLGDYVDRGRQSRQVIDMLVSRARYHDMVFLKGNHEAYVLEFLRNPAIIDEWKYFGGLETLMSYGMTPTIDMNRQEQQVLANAFRHALPDNHLWFLSALKASFSCGDYFFAHAGVRPGVPLLRQQEQDLLWIRDDFLLFEDGFGKIVIHGHTPVKEPDIRPNRINIDTGAYATGKLTCLVLEGECMTFI
jgi:serine/threonine protein phosphatase 1